MNFGFLRVGWYWNHIYTVRLPTVFRYIEGTTPKINLFQFLYMASRTKINTSMIWSSKSCSRGFKACRVQIWPLFWKAISILKKVSVIPCRDSFCWFFGARYFLVFQNIVLILNDRKWNCLRIILEKKIRKWISNGIRTKIIFKKY